ncbi:MAG: 23S rRNA (guanosine(2251)-2'-O)-methyltransferase RlmB [Firmicutes bacterium]|nr:23S rRNA (guanosine(2251)-2'-O)-methyltransferase RlmB [Bacillota bacterium]
MHKNKYNIEEKPTDWVETLQLEGRKAVQEAIKHDRNIDKLLVKKEQDGTVNGTLRTIVAQAKEKGVVVALADKQKLDAIAQSANHQGIIAICPAKEYVDVADILATAKNANRPPFVVILDGIEDPHNLGAILRTAEAGGVDGVIIPKRRAVGLTGAVAKTSAGAIEYVQIARVTNIARTVDLLKQAGLWVVCADNSENNEEKGENGEKSENGNFDNSKIGKKSYDKNPVKSLYDTDLSGAVALVIGAEGKGVSQLVREKSDFVVNIPMLGKIPSLNASVAAGIMIYEVVRCRLNNENSANLTKKVVESSENILQ